MRRTLLIVPVFFAVGFVFFAAPAHAAGSADTLPAKDAVVLKQALDLLQNVLSQLSARFDSGDPVVIAKTDDINDSLADIRGNLFSLDGTLAAFKSGKMIAEESEANEGVLASDASEGEAAANLGFVQDQGFVPSPEFSANANNDQVAAVSSHLYSNRFVWPGVALIVAFAGIWFWRTRNKNRALVRAGSRKNTQPTPGRATV